MGKLMFGNFNQKTNSKLKLISSNGCALKGLMTNLRRPKIENSFPKC
jgi:hypothetical protein